PYGCLISDAVKPVGQKLRGGQRSGLADQHQKGSLKGVFGIMGVCKDASANAHHQSSVTPHDRFESVLVAFAQKGRQKLGITCELNRARSQYPAQMIKHATNARGARWACARLGYCDHFSPSVEREALSRRVGTPVLTNFRLALDSIVAAPLLAAAYL